MLPLFFKQEYLALSSKKMKAATRFPRTVEAYKAHLHEDRPHYDSFQTFCRKQGVRYKGVMQWMHRHNRSVGSLRLEVLLEKTVMTVT